MSATEFGTLWEGFGSTMGGYVGAAMPAVLLVLAAVLGVVLLMNLAKRAVK